MASQLKHHVALAANASFLKTGVTPGDGSQFADTGFYLLPPREGSRGSARVDGSRWTSPTGAPELQ